ncbi:MAG: TonB-dependent receptor [Bacteroidetes bacterium]|nr:TonB-dependent receptor [Bacteroidota bacterium]MBS1974553.1 TonB-dependent receptor [Bacteroidota bacterium]
MLKRLMLTALCAFSSFFLFAQETTSQILGTVTEGTTALAGATVVALHVPSGTKYVTTTRKDGRFNLAGLRVGGPYTITVTYIGFKEEKQDNITLSVGQDFAADFSMTPQSSQLTEVLVTASHQNKIFNNSRTGTQEIITRSQIERLPTVTRAVSDYARLEPSANGLSFGGVTSAYNNITVDGADFNNSFGLSGTLGGQASAQPIALDAIDQIQVNLSPYDVRQGGFTGGGVNSVTKSGTNKYSGSVYYNWRTPGSLGYKVENTTVPRTPFNFSVLGASLGGAIIKNKLFFFINAEQDLQNAPASGVVASDATHSPNPGVVSLSNADTLTALANYLKSTYNYDPGAFQGYSFHTNSYKINARIDYNINNANTLSIKYNYLKSYADQFPSTSRPGAGQITGGQPTSNGNPLPFYGSGYRINNNLNIWIAELNTRLSNKASNKLQIGYTQERDFRSPHSSSSSFPLVDILSNNNIYTTFGYEMYTYHNVLNMDSYQFNDIFTFYKGAHEITIGTQNSYKKYQNAFAPGYQGVFQFNSLSDFYNGAMPKSYYQQYSTLKGGAFPWAYAGATNLSLFAQDKWRVKPNLTLTYGIRFDYTTYQSKFTDNPNFDALTFKNGSQYNVGKAPNSFIVISPRIGFNWDVTGDRKWQIRGGAGIFEGAPPFVWIENQAANNGVQFGNYTVSNIPFSASPSQNLQNYLTATGQSQTSTPTGYGVALIDQKFKYPTKLKTNIGLDRRFEGDWVVTAEFSYSKDINAAYMANINLNQQNGFPISNGPDTRTRYNTAFTPSGTNSSNKYYYSGSSLTNPNISTAIWLANTHKGYSYSTTLRIQKTFRNLFLSVGYTHSDAKNTMEDGSTANSLWAARAVSNTDPNEPTLSRPGWYLPNRIVAFASYKFEYAKHFATSIGLIYEAAPAGVTSYVYNGDLNGDGNTGNDLIYIPRNASEINLIDASSYNSSTHMGSTTGTSSDPRTAAQIWTQLNNFISQDHYLASHRGQYAQANSVVYPWFKHLDLNITQDVYFYTKNKDKDKHTLRFTLDVLNLGNLINKYWGIVKTPASTNFLKFEGMAADGKTPLFSFPFADAGSYTPYVNSFSDNTSLTRLVNNSTQAASRWIMQFGVRYLFN